MDYHTEVIDKKTGALYLMRCTQSMSLSHSCVTELCLSSQALVVAVAKKINACVQRSILDHSIEVSDSFKEDMIMPATQKIFLMGCIINTIENAFMRMYSIMWLVIIIHVQHIYFNIETIICTYGRELGVANCQ